MYAPPYAVREGTVPDHFFLRSREALRVCPMLRQFAVRYLPLEVGNKPQCSWYYGLASLPK